jgi:anti-sigma regulatory factor (Ser/Thr protein kinase)
MAEVNRGSRWSPDSLLLTVKFHAGNVAAVRRQVQALAQRCGMERTKLGDFLVAVNEIMTNAVRHGGGGGQLRLWSNHVLLCQVDDHGSGFDAGPYLERTARPSPSPSGGMGLWLAQRTSDTLAVDSGPAGTTVRIAGNLAAT